MIQLAQRQRGMIEHDLVIVEQAEVGDVFVHAVQYGARGGRGPAGMRLRITRTHASTVPKRPELC
jgi:hypothetical protein